jgi:hypothetical protein
MRMTLLCCPFFIIAHQAVVVFLSSKILFDSSWSISLHSLMLSFDSSFSFLSQLIVDSNDSMSLPCHLLPSGFLFELRFNIKERISPPARPDLLWSKQVQTCLASSCYSRTLITNPFQRNVSLIKMSYRILLGR